MAATSPSPERELPDLIADQIRVFKQPVSLDERELLEYHLRHFRIMTLYLELDRSKATTVDEKPRLRLKLSLQAAADRQSAANRQ